MLASTCIELDRGEEQHFANELPMLVKLPASMANFFLEAGYLEPVYGELRSQARLRVRCPSILQSDFIPAFLGIQSRLSKVLIKDMSRSGLGLISHEQLWPGETFTVEVRERELSVRVVRCRKIADCCFEVGGLVLSIQ